MHPEGLFFIGQTSPVGAILEVAVGSRVRHGRADPVFPGLQQESAVMGLIY